MFDYKVPASSLHREQDNWLNLYDLAAAALFSDSATAALEKYIADNSDRAELARKNKAARIEAVQNDRDRQRTRQQERDAILDADVTLETAVGCDASVTGSGRWGAFNQHKCQFKAKVVRTYNGYNGQPKQSNLCSIHRKVKGQFGWPYDA